MSIEKTKPQGYSAIRLKKEDLTGFFQALRDRKLARVGDESSFKISSKPFVGNSQQQQKEGNTSKAKKKAVLSIDKPKNKPSGGGRGGGGGSGSGGKKRKLENKLKKASF